MKVDNNKPNDDSRELIGSSHLSYTDNLNRGKPISRVANNSSIDRCQHVSNEVLVLMSSPPIQDQVNDNNGSNSE